MPIMILLAIAAAAGLYLMSKKGPGAPLTGPSPSDAAPPTQSPATAGAHDAVSPEDILRAFKVALATETDPAKLDEFASSIPPAYADVAAQLHMRANEIRNAQKVPSNGPQPLPPAPAPDVLPPAPSPQPLPPFPVPDVPPAPQPAVAPADPVFPQPGSYAYVAPHDPGPSGNLNARAAPVSGGVIESLTHNSWVVITDVPQGGG